MLAKRIVAQPALNNKSYALQPDPNRYIKAMFIGESCDRPVKTLTADDTSMLAKQIVAQPALNNNKSYDFQLDQNRYIKAMFIGESFQHEQKQDRPVNTMSADDARLYAGYSRYKTPSNVQPVAIFHDGRRTTVNIPLAPGQKPSPRALSGQVMRSSDVRPSMSNVHRTGYGNGVVYVHVQTPPKSSRHR